METPRIGFQTESLLAPAEALERFFERANLREPECESVALHAALGRVLACDVFADAAYPRTPRSAMDGFALRSADVPGRLRIAGDVGVASPWSGALPAGSAVRIPTGGVVPAGADVVVPVEDAVVEGTDLVVKTSIESGDAVTPAGSDMRAGELMLRRGRRLGAADLGVLATLGLPNVTVFKRPKFAVISSGDELIGIEQQPGPGQIRDSNRYAIGAILEVLGAEVVHAPIVRDERAHLARALESALHACDGAVLTGGSSVGERDFTPEIVGSLGAPGIIVHGLRVKPGKPTLLAAIEGKPVIGLPGNPTSALTILENVGSAIVAASCGGDAPAVFTVADLGEPVKKRAGWTWYVPVRLDEAATRPVAYPLELRSSSTSLLARASGFLVLDEVTQSLPAGAEVRVRQMSGR